MVPANLRPMLVPTTSERIGIEPNAQSIQRCLPGHYGELVLGQIRNRSRRQLAESVAVFGSNELRSPRSIQVEHPEIARRAALFDATRCTMIAS